MLKLIALLTFTITLTACSTHITERNFLIQDNAVIPFTDDEQQQWQQHFTEHKLHFIQTTTRDQQAVLHGLYLDHPESEQVILFIPGNGMKISTGGIQVLQYLKTLKTDIAIFDARGLGASNGQATVQRLTEDASSQLLFIQQQFSPSSIVLHGYSLGGFIAAQVAAQHNVDALVLQGTATDANEWIATRIPWYSKPFVRVSIDPAITSADNRKIVAEQYHNPLLIIAAKKDEQVSPELSRALFDASQSPQKDYLLIQDAGHTSMFRQPAFSEGYQQFLQALPARSL